MHPSLFFFLHRCVLGGGGVYPDAEQIEYWRNSSLAPEGKGMSNAECSLDWILHLAVSHGTRKRGTWIRVRGYMPASSGCCLERPDGWNICCFVLTLGALIRNWRLPTIQPAIYGAHRLQGADETVPSFVICGGSMPSLNIEKRNYTRAVCSPVS